MPKRISPVRAQHCLLLLMTTLAMTSPAEVWGQLPQIRLHSIFPAGGQAGTSVDVVVTGGADLDDARGLLLSHPEIVATPKVIEQDGNTTSVANTFTVTIPADAQPGVYDIRVAGRFGVSNPRSFEVTERQELIEVESNDTVDDATLVPLDCVVNGRANGSADVDVYRFQGRKNQRVLVECRAASLDSRLLATVEAYDVHGRRLAAGRGRAHADALIDLTLPADGAYYVRVLDAVFRGGDAYFYRLHLHTGPHIDFVLPSSGVAGSTGTYTLFGRNLPGGLRTGVRSSGCSLETLDVQITLPDNDSLLQLGENAFAFQAHNDQIDYALESAAGRSNRVPIHFARGPVVLEIEPNNNASQAQLLDVGTEVVGQFQAPGDIDFFQFAAQAQEVLWIEVFGHRDGSGADPYLILEQILLDQNGKESGVKRITAQDDIATDLFPGHFSTCSDDARFQFTVPADGPYRISLRDRYFESRGDPRLVYRVAIRRARPDFRLVVVPFAPLDGQKNNTAAIWPVGLRRGDRFAVRLLALRRDGFTGPIAIEVDGLPPGVSCQCPGLDTGQSQTTLVFTAAEEATAGFTTVRVTGKAQIPAVTDATTDSPQVQEIVRLARTGTIVWDGDQQRPAVARLSRELGLSVLNEVAPLQMTTDVTRVEVNRNRQILIPVKLIKRNDFDNDVKLVFQGQPPKVEIEPQTIPKGMTEQVQRIFVPPTTPLGTYTLLMRGQGQVTYTRPVADAADTAKPQNLNVFPPADAIVLCIKKEP